MRLARVDKGTDDVIRSVSVDVAVDDLGRATKPFFLDWIGYLGFLAAILACQTLSPWQATPACASWGFVSSQMMAVQRVSNGLLCACFMQVCYG